MEILAVEGVERTVEQLRSRCNQNSFPNVKISVCHGLVGLRAGNAYIYDGLYANTDTVVKEGGRRSCNPFRNAYAVASAFVDIEQFLPPDCMMDLIKCETHDDHGAIHKRLTVSCKFGGAHPSWFDVGKANERKRCDSFGDSASVNQPVAA